MKKIITCIGALCFITGVMAQGSGSASTNITRTIANLKAEYQHETNMAAKYAAYATKASEEGYPQIAVLFKATSQSETIHATHARLVLERIGIDEVLEQPDFKVKTTAENLQDAFDEQTVKAASVYPVYLSDSKADNVPDAIRTFTWASNTEKKHIEFYKAALIALNSKTVASLPAFYWICPKCGNTFNEVTPAEKCPFCYTPSEKYTKVM